jgi:hypothetical protein
MFGRRGASAATATTGAASAAAMKAALSAFCIRVGLPAGRLLLTCFGFMVGHLFGLIRVRGGTSKAGQAHTGDLAPSAWRLAVTCVRAEPSHGRG